MDKAEAWFKLKERRTTIGTEVLAGCTTFMTMAFVVIVNPGILSASGMDFHAVFIATILTTILSTLIIALAGNYPIVIAPGMGINAFFAFGVVQGAGVSWQVALGSVFLAGLLFMLISLSRHGRLLIESIPASLKYAITAGTGLFICFVGLQNAKLIVASPDTLVTIGSLHEPAALLSVIGLVLTLVLMSYRVRAALFIGMLLTAAIGWLMGLLILPDHWFAWPGTMTGTFMQMDVKGVFEQGLFAVTFTFLLISVFDTTGTLVSLAEQAGLMKNGVFPRSRSALMANAAGVTAGAVMGTSPVTTLIESGSGIAAGGRTGLTAVVTCALLAATSFLAPVAETLANLPSVTAPALIVVGYYMITDLLHIDWKDFEESFPAFLVLVTMPLTYSVSTSIGIGFIFYIVLKAARGRFKEIHPVLYVFAALFIVQIGFFHG
ncbi:NCS2 family permease [Paenibacillus chitinolyticus]|uniref:NCS2 family permease n=1 Tax=Paenibacillus chitinolyticus TaxID=79263 RepID=A0A410WVU8_9BACL|nr:NCS2 family permease [Paenibacillus chitinolyticus]MCY9592769.1 NCS2 family permease [Paenibacillus chitinolyticus]MCY9597629.1 NCS2 family permease [Paenibacillus chitinolyticus]QAV18616.1 NCS2 family permease [Paenibacillus chitinolyticus]